MNIGPVDYGSAATPDGYRCATCGTDGCKLWRRAYALANHGLLCCKCAGKSQGEDVSGIDADGKIESDIGRTDQIGGYVPAVPTAEGDTFWTYAVVPAAARAWWRRLPTRAVKS